MMIEGTQLHMRAIVMPCVQPRNVAWSPFAMAAARAAKQIAKFLKQAIHVLPNKFARALNQVCMCCETSLHVL